MAIDSTMPGDDAERTLALRARAHDVLEAAWVDPGYSAPNTEVYPWLWLWDSCFHAVIWLALGEPERGLTELDSALSTIDDTGFVAHMGYQRDPQRSVELWGRAGASSITQPPMYGHVVAAFVRAGVEVAPSLIDRADAGLRFLLERRRRIDGLVPVVHPWETGCDDAPRWDDFCGVEPFDREVWRRRKMELLATVERDATGAPVANPEFEVASVGFNALVAWNARELATVTGDQRLEAAADELAAALDARFDPHLRTWIDAGSHAAGSGRCRTADALLPLLVTADGDARVRAVEEILDEDGYASAHGPRGVHVGEPTYDPDHYWRGPVWPQIAYLLWLALRRSDDVRCAEAAEVVRTTTISGARESGFAEYWNGELGTGLGAVPQSWTGLAVLLDAAG